MKLIACLCILKNLAVIAGMTLIFIFCHGAEKAWGLVLLLGLSSLEWKGKASFKENKDA